MVSLPRVGLTTIIPATDGYPLGATIFEPRRPRATVVIHGATAVPHGYYAGFAEHVAETRRLRVVTYDYRGVGASRPSSLRGFEATMTDWAHKDARAVHAWARDRGDPIAMIGHSFGGQMIGLLDELRDARVAVLVASQLGWYRDWPIVAQPKLALLWHVATPVLTSALGYLPAQAGLGVDLPSGVAREWARWCTSRGYLADHDHGAADRFDRWDVPTLMLSFDDDDYAPPRTVRALRRRLARAPLEHRASGAGGHFGFFRAKHAALWPDALDFIDRALAGDEPRTDVLTIAELEADLSYGR